MYVHNQELVTKENPASTINGQQEGIGLKYEQKIWRVGKKPENIILLFSLQSK